MIISTHPRTFDAHETARLLQLNGKPLAPFKNRAAAFILDFALAFVLFTALLILSGRLAKILNVPIADVTLKFDFEHWYSILFLVIYFALSTYWTNGRTIGKWLFRIKVVSLLRERMSFWQSIERALGYGASFLEFGFGFLQYFIHPNRRTVHDRIAETIVVQDRKRATDTNNRSERTSGEVPPG